MENLVIREIKISDNVELANMIREVFEEYDAPRQGTVFSDPTTDDLFSLFKQTGSILWVAELDGEIAGCCGVYPTEGLPEKCAELVKYYLPAFARGKSIGRALMEKCIESAKQMGYDQLYIESLPDFDKAIRIYEKQGFVMLSERLGNSGHDSCNIWMLKQL